MKIARRKPRDKYPVPLMSSSTLKVLLVFQSMDLFLDHDHGNLVSKLVVTVGTVKRRQESHEPDRTSILQTAIPTSWCWLSSRTPPYLYQVCRAFLSTGGPAYRRTYIRSTCVEDREDPACHLDGAMIRSLRGSGTRGSWSTIEALYRSAYSLLARVYSLTDQCRMTLSSLKQEIFPL
jgi:hypothetical protein